MLNQHPTTKRQNPTDARIETKSLADMIIEMIQAHRDEINRMSFGEIRAEIQHHTLYGMDIAPHYRYSDIVKSPLTPIKN